MVRKLIWLILMLLINNDSSAKFLIKLDFNYVRWVGHGVTMYYSVDNLTELDSYIQKIDTISERKILASCGIPITEIFPDDSCESSGKVVRKLDRYFKGYKKKLKVENENVYIDMQFIKVDYHLCIFPIYNKHWGSYDVHFLNIGTITSEPQKIAWKNDEKKLIKKILFKLRSTPVHPYWK